jgi:hypothetical protein
MTPKIFLQWIVKILYWGPLPPHKLIVHAGLNALNNQVFNKKIKKWGKKCGKSEEWVLKKAFVNIYTNPQFLKRKKRFTDI